MNKTIVRLAALGVLLVVIYFGYQLIDKWLNPCDDIFRQSVVSIGAKLDVVKAKGEVAIGSQKIQELDKSAHQMAVNLKTCCIVCRGRATPEFLRCKEGFERYDAAVRKVASSIEEAEAARQQGNTAATNRKIVEASEGLKAADTSAREFATQVKELQENPPTKDTPKGKEGLSAPLGGGCCVIVSNPELKSLGRIVVPLPGGTKASPRIDIFNAQDDKKAILSWWGAGSRDLMAGQYVAVIGGRRVAGVEVRAGHDTKIRVGVLRLHTGSGTQVTIFEREGKDAVTSFWGGQEVGLPIGEYDVQIAANRARITIKDNTVTEF